MFSRSSLRLPFALLGRRQSLSSPSPSHKGFHTDVVSTHATRGGITDMFTEMFSASPQPPTDRIHKFMNALYVDSPKNVTLFSINYKTQTERATVKGLRVGPSHRQQKNVVLVSGLPLQDPSTIAVNLYIAAVLSRSPLGRDVSVIPLAHPHEYERVSSLLPPHLTPGVGSSRTPTPSVAPLLREEPLSLALSKNLSFQDTCKPIEAYVTRHNKYYVNAEVNMTSNGSTVEYKSNTFSTLVSRGKCRDFFLDPSAPLSDSAFPPPFPGHFLGKGSMIPYTQVPSVVLELRSAESFSDEQIQMRGEEVINRIKELLD